MNTDPSATPQPVRRPDRNQVKDGALAELAGIFAAAKRADTERAPYVAECLEAARRLAAFAWSQAALTEQAETITRALASIYNGQHGRRVRLDEIRWLDWQHQRDLVAVMLGTGQTGTDDTHIRHAFAAAGGAAAVDWFHSHLDAGAGDEAAGNRRLDVAERVRVDLTQAANTYRDNTGGDYLARASKTEIREVIAQSLAKAEAALS